MSGRHIITCEILDPQGGTWGEFMRLGAEDRAALEGVLTPRAFRALLGSEATFAHLSGVFGLIFSNVAVFTLTPGGFRRLEGVGARARYSPWFVEAQLLTRLNMQAQMDNVSSGVCDISRFQNMSFAFSSDANGGRIVGYSPYFRFTCPDILGEERLFVFYHREMRKVALVSIPGAQHMPAVLQFICGKGLAIPFDKACGWCGKTSEDLMKCPCKGVRYCDAACQRLHWGLHGPECPLRRS